MMVWGTSTWSNCFSQNFCWIKLEIQLSACFPIFNEFQTVCRVWELPKQRGGMTSSARISFVTYKAVPTQQSLAFCSELHQAALSSEGKGEIGVGRAGPTLGQTNPARIKHPDSLFTRNVPCPCLCWIRLDANIFNCVFFFFFYCCLLTSRERALISSSRKPTKSFHHQFRKSKFRRRWDLNLNSNLTTN